jgi:hypothetical protein
MRSKIIASSFTSAMLRSRCAFSMTLAASAVRMFAARCTPAVMNAAVKCRDPVERLFVATGNDLHDPRNHVLFVARD